MNTMKRQNVSAIVGTRNVTVAEAKSIATANIAADRIVEDMWDDVPEHLTFIMLQTDLLSNETKMPKRTPRGMNGHNGTGKNARKRKARREAEMIGSTLDLENARRLNQLQSMGTQATID